MFFEKLEPSFSPAGEREGGYCHGFTSHEFLADFNLYNMNGRLYDPVVGRFLSPDPYIADPSFSQSYNLYAYALNNPLKFTDPSGEKLKWPKFEWFNAIPVIGQFDYLMQFINDNTTKTRQKMVNAGVPDFGAGISFSGNGTVNFNGSYRGQEVFNTQNINKGNPDVVLNELVQVRRDYGEEWMAQGRGGGQTNWGLYVTGAVLTAEDIYNNFYHNHTTYTTLAGEVKNIYKANGAVRSARAAQFARTSTTVKVLGTAGTALMTGVATYNIVDAVSNNRSVSGWDIADGSVGAIGLTGAGLTSVGIISNPVGWGIGAGVATYSWGRLWFDLGTSYGPSKWYGTNDYKWFE